MGELPNRREALEVLMGRLREGRNPEELTDELNRLSEEMPLIGTAQVEGLPTDKTKGLCDVHLAVFKEAVEKEVPLALSGHPIHILMEEHKILLQFALDIRVAVNQIREKNDFSSAAEPVNQVNSVMNHFRESKTHYMREENVLFPYLEKHRMSRPSSIMWNEHSKIKEIKKNLYKTFDLKDTTPFRDFTKQLDDATASLVEMLSSHFYKEYNVLFLDATKVIQESEWREIRYQFDEVGYCDFTPEPARKPFVGEKA